jgi:hypothetical protein
MNTDIIGNTGSIRRISSRATFFHKRVFPTFWFGFIAVFLLVAMPAIIIKGEWSQIVFLIVPVFMLIFGYFLMKKLVFDLADVVWDAGDTLIVKNKGQEEHIPLSEIMNVSYTFFSSPPRVTLTLRHPGRFGKEVVFCPQVSWNPFAKSPIIEELIERIDAKRRG